MSQIIMIASPQSNDNCDYDLVLFSLSKHKSGVFITFDQVLSFLDNTAAIDATMECSKVNTWLVEVLYSALCLYFVLTNLESSTGFAGLTQPPCRHYRGLGGVMKLSLCPLTPGRCNSVLKNYTC